MKVAINARLLAEPTVRGWNRYTLNLLMHLPGQDVHPVLMSDRPLHPDHLSRLPPGSYTQRIAPPMKYGIWEQQWLANQCAEDAVQILHSPFNFGLPWKCACPRILTLHDAIDQAYYRPLTNWRQRLKLSAMRSASMHWVARRAADRFITVSNHAKADLVRYFKIAAEKIDVTYEAADDIFHQPIAEAQLQTVREQFGLHRPYLFYIGGWERRKNIPFLLQAFAQANVQDLDLVLAGGGEHAAELHAMTQTLGISERTRFIGAVSDADLPALYAGALAFVYPSEYEGFGLQLCEAMAVGCPVLAADATSLPEILGDGGETFSLQSVEPLEALIRRVATDTAFQQELRERARQRSTHFSWRTLAQETADIYRQLARSR